MSQYLEQFRAIPTDSPYTVIVCSHPQHGVSTYYLPDDMWHENLVGILRSYWINGYTVLMHPGSPF